MKDVNELEPIGSLKDNSGRSALYWACLTGHDQVVKVLLDFGARDFDGSAFQAATCSNPVRAKMDDRDLLFDPDQNIYTDYVERTTVSALTDGSDEASRKIRSLLTARNVNVLTCPAPKIVFDRPSASCCVCFESFSIKPAAVASPCGHCSTCQPCLIKIRENHMGCPECRAHIRGVIQISEGREL